MGRHRKKFDEKTAQAAAAPAQAEPVQVVETPGYVKTLQLLSLQVGVSYRTILSWRVGGQICQEPNGSWSIEKALVVKEAMKEVNGGDRTGGSSDWKDRKLAAQAQMAEAELKEKLGTLVEKAEVVRLWNDRLREVRLAFQSMGKDIAPRLQMKKALEIQGLIDEHVFFITNKLADNDGVYVANPELVGLPNEQVT